MDYQVGAPHFDPNGNVFKGTYDLLMSSSVARCLYKFSNAPIKATISVTNSSGSSEVATTVVSEKDNWLHMQAANFEFSSPTIKIKLSQEGQGSQPLSKVAAKKTTCFKGKLTKVVSTSNCPVGYKRK